MQHLCQHLINTSMNLRCKKCGKFVAKDATVCKYCGIENPIERTPPQYHKCDTKSVKKNTSEMNSEKVLICPFCNSSSYISHELLNEKHLLCNFCGNTITNPFYEKKLFRMSKEQIAGLVAALFFAIIIGLSSTNTEPPIKLEQGQECVFTTNIMGGINEEADNLYVKYAVRDDTYGILELQMKGVVYGAFKGDPCIFIRNKSQGRVEVYLKNKGVNILVPKESIRPQ